MKTWMVRAGTGGRFFELFKEENLVAIGWRDVGNLSNYKSRDEVFTRVRSVYPESKDQQVMMAASQLYRFAKEFKIGDRVITYDSGGRRYLCGTIDGDYKHVPTSEDEELQNVRSVNWSHEKPRDELSSQARNTLGAISTIFAISEEVSRQLWQKKSPNSQFETDLKAVDPEQATEASLTFVGISELAAERIKDRLTKLSDRQMEMLVAGILRAMGYQTRVSHKGADRGSDIVASPDGFGFQEPRIVVEVKHRPKERMSAPEIRSFLGGRHNRDKGLYVSTGGFSKEAHYEADRASIPMTTWDFAEMTETLIRHYEKLDQETRQLIPLKSVYWTLED